VILTLFPVRKRRRVEIDESEGRIQKIFLLRAVTSFPLSFALYACIYIWPFAFYLIECNVFSLFNLICEYVRPCNLNAACGELCDLWHDWLNCHGENDVSWLMTSHKGFQIFVQSHSWKFPSANGNVNENENIL